MGLDGVELILAVEEEFGVEITVADAEKLRTPRDLVDCLLAKIAAARPEVCQSQRAFYTLRRALSAQTGQPRKTITPATPLADLLPEDVLDPAWSRLREAVQPERWPAPVRPPGLVRALANAVCLLSIITAFVLVPRVLPSLAAACGLMGARVIVLVAAACVLGPLAARLTRSRRRRMPVKIVRVGDLAKFVRKRGPEPLPAARVAEKVRKIVMEQLGVSPDKYREDAEFVKDYGMD